MKNKKAIIEQFMNHLSKSEEQLTQEKVESFIDNLAIEIDIQVAKRKLQLIPEKELAIKQHQQKHKEALKDLENARYTSHLSPKDYIDNILKCKNNINYIKSEIDHALACIDTYKNEIDMYQNIINP
jgi:hypothetical protein